MKLRAFWMLGLALVLAGASVFLARTWIQGQIPPPAVVEAPVPQIELTTVVVAATPLFFGNHIRREHLREQDWPADAVPPNSFSSIDELVGGGTGEAGEAGEAGAGKPPPDRVALRAIQVNEPILKGKITGFGGRAALSAILEPGMRATTIRMNAVTGVAGFVLPGDHVDIMLTRSAGQSGSASNLITDILLQNIRVLGIDQDANEERDKPGVVKAVTIEVTPTQAQKLVLAQRVGELSLALRHLTNTVAEVVKTVTIKDLRVGEANRPLGEEPKKPKKTVIVKKTRKKKEGLSVRIVRGTTASKYEVQAEKRPLLGSGPVQPQAQTPSRSLLAETPPPNLSTPAAQASGGATSPSIAVQRSPAVSRRVSAPLSLLEPFNNKASVFEEAGQ